MRALHNREAGRIDSGEFVQVGAPKVLPRLLEIAQLVKAPGDLGPAVDENRLPLPHQGSSWTLSCSMEVRRDSPSQMATGPATCGLSTVLRIASRTSCGTLRTRVFFMQVTLAD